MLDNATVTRTGEDKAYIGCLSHSNPSYQAVNVGDHFVYDKYNYLSNWVGYQVGIKVSDQYMIPVNLPFNKLHDAIFYCSECQETRIVTG
jgi:hypothetical protein